MLLDNAEFLRELKSLLESQVKSGSVFMTQKRYTYEDAAASKGSEQGQDVDMPAASTSSDPGAHKEYPCIIKATNGKHAGNKAKKIKISTLVQPSDTDSFALAYGSILKTHFAQTMRKKAKKRKDKEREKATSSAAATAAADSKKRRRHTKSGLPKVSGARRGAGHFKRQNTLKARAKAAKRLVARKQTKLNDERILARLPKKEDAL